jgi:outer membrane protein assembly factor BamB
MLMLAAAVTPARALIDRPYPLQKAIEDGKIIFTAQVDKLDPDKPSAVLTAGEALKGKVPFKRLPINLTGDDDSRKKKETPQLLKRLAPKLTVVVFVSKEEKQYLALVYSNGTWFQMTAEEGGENPVWAFTHCEPYLRRTFKGTTAEMQQTIADAVAGKKEPPPVDAKEKPGLGPEVDPKKDEKPAQSPAAAGASDGPPFAVIPTVAIGGIVSLLAMLFPAVFGGLTGQLKRWLAVITVGSLNTTLLWGYAFVADWLPERWRVTDSALWVALTIITALGVLWAWRRQLREAGAGPAPADAAEKGAAPSASLAAGSRYELILLLILSGAGAVLFVVCHLLKYPLLSLPWGFVLALWVGIWAGTLYVMFVRWRQRRPGSGPALSSEGVMLWAMVPACLALAGMAPAVTSAPAPGGTGGGVAQTSHAGSGAKVLDSTLVFLPPRGAGYVAATPLLDGDRMFVAAAHAGALNRWHGKVYCVDRTKPPPDNVVWEFSNGGKMKQIYSSPCLADGRLYIGEGFHGDSGCRLYCLDAATGNKVWEFQTESHTESSPCVSDGKVYCGAGADGLYCLDARSGDVVWRYEGKHVDCPPVVVGKRVYCGSGTDRDLEAKDQPETAVFCLDANTGKEVWKVPTTVPGKSEPLAAWGKPHVEGDRAYFVLGNKADGAGTQFSAAGAVLCVATADGAVLWRHDLPEAVIEGPAVDAWQVYVGCEDGSCYALGRHDGKPRWKYDLGSPVSATPALAACSCCGQTDGVFAAGSGGKVVCLDPVTGRPFWEKVFPGSHLSSMPVVALERARDGEKEVDRRFVYLGAGMSGDAQAAVYCLKDQKEP